MPEDKELLAREEPLDLRHFLARDGGNIGAFFPLRLAPKEDMRCSFNTRKHLYLYRSPIYLFQFNIANPARQPPFIIATGFPNVFSLLPRLFSRGTFSFSTTMFCQSFAAARGRGQRNHQHQTHFQAL